MYSIVNEIYAISSENLFMNLLGKIVKRFRWRRNIVVVSVSHNPIKIQFRCNKT